MAVSEVYGLSRFAEYMRGLEDCYTVIGGTACDVLLSDADLAFRATKDIDLVLLIENRFPSVARAVWKLVEDGGYTCGWKSSDDVHFYRFTEPKAVGFPSMIELFSKAPFFIEGPEGLTLAPLPVNDEISSLSAILLDDDYYDYMRSGRKTINGVTVLDEVHLVPFKARAHIDLSARKARGEHVNSGDLKKHKKDVFRLAQLFRPDTSSALTESIKSDMTLFCDMVRKEGVPLAQKGIPLALDEAIDLLRRVYGL